MKTTYFILLLGTLSLCANSSSIYPKTVSHKQIFLANQKLVNVEREEILNNGQNESVKRQQVITGVITDAYTLDPLPGVNIVIEGTGTGVITDIDGKYTIESPEEGTKIVFSYVGYLTETITFVGQTTIDITLVQDITSLDEIVVVGYGVQKKKNVISSIASMDADRLNERPVTKVDQALIGQMAGVRVRQTTGTPGKGFSIQIRGTGSITANNEPLYVVDGFPMEVSPQTENGGFDSGNPLTNLNPNDIESIQVLKDAAAAAIYGSRGSNGVVMITTKTGKKGKPQITFNTYAGWNETVKKLDVLSSEEWIDRQIEHMDYFWVRDYGKVGATSSQSNDERRELYNSQHPDNPLGPDQYNVTYMKDERWEQEGHPGLDYVDWQDLFFRKGQVQSFQLSANGGNETIKYYVSGDYLDQDGIAIGVGYKRYSARANVEISPNEKLKFGLNLSPSYSEVKDPGVEGKDALMHLIVGMNPVVESSTGAEGTNVGENTRYAWGTSRVSPIASANNRDKQSNTFRTISTSFLQYEIINGLRFKTSINFDIHNNEGHSFTPSIVDRNRTASGSASGYVRINFVNENTLNYNLSLGGNSISILGGYSYSSFSYKNYSVAGTGYPSDDVATINAASGTSGKTESRKNVLLSYFSRVQYNYDSKYFLQASLRRDGSSKFGDNTKWGIFPSASVGWKISEEYFMENLEQLSDFKLRGSWGLTGNNGVEDYDQVSKLGYANYSNGGSLVNGLVSANFANPDLGWETSETFDIGVDVGILESRVYASFDIYRKRNTDLLLNIPVPTSSGYREALTNIGEVLNKGWEFEILSRNLVGDFKWSTQFNFSHNENEVIKLGPNDSPIYGGLNDITHNVLEVGKPMYTLFLVQQDGLLTTADIENGVAQYETQEAGDPKYIDQNNDNTIDSDDRTYSGHPNPDYVWGITNNFAYKGFDLSIMLQGQWGGKIYSTFGRAMYRTGQGSSENTLGKSRDRIKWVEGQVLTEEDVAGKERKSPSSFGRIKNTDWLYPNDYWRIRNITLGYDLGKVIQNKYITGARVYVTAENWFGGDKYEGGFNPEAVNSSGDDYGAFPLSKSIVFGLNLKF